MVTIGQVPTEYALEQNFPNPFNLTTQIMYQLPEASEIHLVIYDLLGQKVRTLVNTQQAPGFYRVQWDGQNDAGVDVAAGVYLYRIRAKYYQQTRKMLLLK